LLTHAAAFAGPIVAEKLGLPWLSVVLQPMLFFSAYDPPVIPGAEWVRHLYSFGPTIFRALMRITRLRLDRWAAPVQKLRGRLGLPPSSVNPLIDGSSPFGTLALFSRALAQPQPDWPPNTSLCGFVYYDELGEIPGAAPENDWELRDFLRAGPPPVLFTLGSSAVMHPGEFFRESIAAVHTLGARAVLLAGPRQSEIRNPLPDSIFVAGYVPFSKIMPASAAIVHQGGIGTTAQALRAGRPMLVVPWSHDQPDNAERIRRLGYGRTVPRNRYYAPRVSDELKELLTQAAYSQRAAEAAAQIASEDGIGAACDEIESALRLPLLTN
jgi:UDP:flavonoid glycosyltransferase YjiC (YdhE family)